MKNNKLEMNKYLKLLMFAIALLAISTSLLAADNKNGNDGNGDIANVPCASIVFSHEITEDCCVMVYTSWPFTFTDKIIDFEKLVSGVWTSVGTSTANSASMKICPNSGETSVTFRVRWKNDYNGGPRCFSDFTEWNEADGGTQYTRTVDLSCCGCPTGINDWVSVKAKKSNDCPNNGCKIDYKIVIPEGNTCFTSFRAGSSTVTSISSNTTTGFGPCINASTSANYKIVFFKANGDSCVVTKSVTCDAVQDTNTVAKPCIPDCPGDTFRIYGPTIFALSGCPGCFVRVTYGARKACGVFQDLQILKMELSPACTTSCSMDSIFKQTVLGIIDFNAMGFDPMSTGCNTTWRIAQGGCWASWTYYKVNPTSGITDTVIVWEPCEKTACCLQPMTVCKYTNPKRIVITYGSAYNGVSNCNDTWLQDKITGWIFPCSPKCDWLNGLEGSHLGIANPGDSPIPMFKTSNKGDYGVGISVTIKDKLLAMMIKNEQSASTEITISNLKGEIVNKTNFKLHSNDNYFNIDLNNYETGTYVYSITIDGIIFQTDKFIIAK